MSLTLALHTALSGLSASQTILAVTSSNVANATTPGYARKVAQLESLALNGVGAGVGVAGIARVVDDFLAKDLRTLASGLGHAEVDEAYRARVQLLFGRPGEDAAPGDALDRLSAALEAHAVEPESPTARSRVAEAATALAHHLNGLAQSVTALRRQADQEIADAVARLQADLDLVAEINVRIAQNLALDRPIGELQDQRDAAVSRIAREIDITDFQRGNGEIVIQTRSGVMLLDQAAPILSFRPASTMSDDGSGLDTIALDGIDIAGDIRSGRLRGLLDQRDAVLPSLAAEIDRLASVLHEEINAAHNRGAPFPPPGVLTGSRAVDEPLSAGGTVRIAAIDLGGPIDGAVAEIDLAALPDPATLADVVALINAAPALAGLVTASTVEERLVLTAADGHGIAIDEGDSAVAGPDGHARGFSHAFGLNDLLVYRLPVATDGTGAARSLTLRSDIAADPALLSRGLLADAAPLLTAGDGRAARDLAALFGRALTFEAAGAMPETAATLSDYAGRILALQATEAAAAAERLAFRRSVHDDLAHKASSISGVNLDEELAKLVLHQNAYAANARLAGVAREMFDTLLGVVR